MVECYVCGTKIKENIPNALCESCTDDIEYWKQSKLWEKYEFNYLIDKSSGIKQFQQK
ncbi:MAG: hypothetical protein ACXAAH_00980 [Promethearchaeota archaeon]|jgi:hypothetical protein